MTSCRSCNDPHDPWKTIRIDGHVDGIVFASGLPQYNGTCSECAISEIIEMWRLYFASLGNMFSCKKQGVVS